jgi:hypothetical protein
VIVFNGVKLFDPPEQAWYGKPGEKFDVVLKEDYDKLEKTTIYTGECNALNADKANRLEAALRRARPYVLNHECADAAELEAQGLTLRAIDLALRSVSSDAGEQQ